MYRNAYTLSAYVFLLVLSATLCF